MHMYGLNKEQTVAFLQPKTFTDFVAENASDIKELLDAYPYRESFTEVLAVLRNLQEYHQQLPENFGSSFGVPEGILKFAVRKTIHALTLLKRLPFHLEMPVIEREEQKRLVFNVILLAGLGTNIAHGDSSFRVDGFDSSQNKVASRRPGTSLAEFFRTSGLRSVKLHLKATPDHDYYPAFASTILHRIGGQMLDEIRNGSHTKLYVFLVSYIERRYDHAELLDSQLFNVLSQAAHNVREENFMIHGNYVGEPQIPHMAAEIAKILCSLFKKEFSVETGNELKRKMVCMQDGEVFLRYPHAFDFISELFREQSPETLIPLNGTTLISCMARAGMLHVIPNTSLEKKPFLEPNPDKRSSNTHIEVSGKAIRLISPESYLSESSLTFKELTKQRKAVDPEHQFTESLRITNVIPAHPTAGSYIAETKLTEQTKATGRLTRQEAFIKIVGEFLSEITPERLFPAKKSRKSSKREMALSFLEKEISNLMEQDKSAKEKELLGHMKVKYSEQNLFPYQDKSTNGTSERTLKTESNDDNRSLSSSMNKEQKNPGAGPMVSQSRENLPSLAGEKSLFGTVYLFGRYVKTRLSELFFREEENKQNVIVENDYSSFFFNKNLTCNFISKNVLTADKVSLSKDAPSVVVLVPSANETYKYSSAFTENVSAGVSNDTEENIETCLTINRRASEEFLSSEGSEANNQPVENGKDSGIHQVSENFSDITTKENLHCEGKVTEPIEGVEETSTKPSSDQDKGLTTTSLKKEHPAPVESSSAKNNAENKRSNPDAVSASQASIESFAQKKTSSSRRTQTTSSVSDKRVTTKNNPSASKSTKTSDKGPIVKNGKAAADAKTVNSEAAPWEAASAKTPEQKSSSKKTLKSPSTKGNTTGSKKDENTKNNPAKNPTTSLSKDAVSTKKSGSSKTTTSSTKMDKDSTADKKSESRKTTASSASGKSSEESKTKAQKAQNPGISKKTPDSGSSPRSRTRPTKTVGTGK